jgi:hypothetical protein
VIICFGAILNLCSLTGAEEPGGHWDCGGVGRDPELAGPSYYDSAAPVEVGYFRVILLFPLVFRLWDLFM